MSTPPLDSLAAQLDPAAILVDPADTAPYLTDWRRRYTGRALAIVRPADTEAVARTVRWCAAHRVAVVPQGGNTGMAGGATPDDSGRSIVLSLARLNRLGEVDRNADTLIAQAGCTLASVQVAARAAGRLFALSLAAEGTATIGGNLSTNAGGTQVLRYGNARAQCLGLEVVTADGEIWNGLRGLRKDNTGYDLRDLFIGAEGTLGVITAACLALHPLPSAQVTAFAALDSPAQALALLSLARDRLGADLTAFELISSLCLDLVERHFPAARRPVDARTPYYVLLETSDNEGEHHARAAFESLLEAALERGLITDAAIAASLTQSAAIWSLRENISEAQAREGQNVKHDISLPISTIPAFVERTNAALEAAFPGIRMVVFGHLGDGNLHYNVSPGDSSRQAEAALLARQPEIHRLTHDAVVAAGGSISAEHGLGQLRRDEAARYKSPVEMALMRRIKDAFDPLGIMNPGKVLARAL